MTDRIYPAKVLLFGEYTVLEGAQALAIPFGQRKGCWALEDAHTGIGEDQDHWEAYMNWLKREKERLSFIDIERLISDFNDGWRYKSDIPVGYGLGSSGAVCAALYDRYNNGLLENDDIIELRHRLAALESYFHGKSSGTDPLISYLNQSILRGRNEQNHIVELPPLPQDWGIFLIDSGEPRSTVQFVEKYQAKMEQKDFEQMIQAQLVPSVEHAIHFLLQGSWEMFWAHLQIVSSIQFSFFQEMIPADMHHKWEAIGKEKDIHQMKLCGAGGGGYFLVFSKNVDRSIKLFSDHKVNFLKIM